MNTDNQIDDSRMAEQADEQEHWDLLWGVRRSIRYHRRRERWLDGWNNACAFAVAAFGSASLASLLTGIDQMLLTITASGTALAGALQLAFGLARGARTHSDLARDFVELERDMMLAGEEIPKQRLRQFQARRVEIESREPPVLTVLNVICHDELVTAYGIESGERSNLRFYHRWFANMFDVAAHQLRKQNSP